MLKIKTSEISILNGKLVAFFLFQYSLLIPIMGIVTPAIVVAISSIIILMVAVIINFRSFINIKITIFYISMLIILLIKTIWIEDANLTLLIMFFLYALPPGILLHFYFAIDAFLQMAFCLAYINFFINFLNPFMSGFSYMRFGYGMVLTVIVLYVKLSYYRKDMNRYQIIFCIVIMIIAMLEIVFYGARGSLLVFIMFVAIDVLCIGKRNVLRNSIVLTIALIIYCNLEKILEIFLVLSEKIGIYSYSLTKFIIQLNLGWDAASSGRDALYEAALEKIYLHPFLGNPIQSNIEEGEYVHNLFLQVTLDLGFFGLLAVVFLIICAIFLLVRRKGSVEKKIGLAIFFSISIGRLLFSSTLWARPEFWMLVCYVIIYMSDGRVRHNKYFLRKYMKDI